MVSEQKKAEISARIQRDVDEFLRNGGEIQQVDHTASKWYRDKEKKRRPHVPMTVRKNAGHCWTTPRNDSN